MLLFENVTKEFFPGSFGLSDISFEISPGEFTLITGKSGAGKTTIMRLITKEYTPSDGKIVFDEVNLNDLPMSQVHKLRRKVGVVFQDYRLLPELNVWENIALPLSIVGKKQTEIEERVTDLLTLIGIPEKSGLFPSQISGGEAQRVSIARALAMAPNLIFADEPTGNLDEETSLSIAKLVEKINNLGTTVLFATHDPIIIDYFSGKRHLILESGKLVHDSSRNQERSQQSKKSKKTKEKKIER